MNFIKNYSLVFVLSTIFIISFFSYSYSEVILLKTGWEYKVGDCLDKGEWRSIKKPSSIPDRNNNKVVWFRIQIPNKDNLAIHCSNVDQCFSLYVDQEEFYAYGDVNDFRSSFSSHLVPIPKHKDSFLYMRVYSGWSRLGLYANDTKIGTVSELQNDIVKGDLKFVILAFLLIISGIIIIFTVIKRIEPIHYFFIGMFSIFLGCYTFIHTDLKNILSGNNHVLWGTEDLIILYTLPFFVMIFICKLFNCSWKNPFRYLSILSLTYAIFACITAIINPNFLVTLINFNFYYLGFIVISIIIFSLYYSVKGSLYAKLILLTFIICSCFVGHDIVKEMGIISSPLFLSPWGQILLLSVFGYIAIKDANKHTHRKKLNLFKK